MKRNARVTALVAVMILFIAVPHSSANDWLIIGTIGRSVFNWPVYVMLEKGFTSIERQKTKFVMFGDEERALSALASGAVQTLGVVGTERVLQNQIRGVDIEITGGVVSRASYYLLISPKIESLEQLKGKLIGVPNHRSGASNYYLYSYLNEKNLSYPKDYRVARLVNDDFGYSAVKYGKTSAALVPSTTTFEHENERIADKKMWKMSLPDYQSKVVAMNRDWAKSNKREAARIMYGLIEGLRWLHERRNREEAVKILIKHTKTRPEIAQSIYSESILKNSIFSLDAYISPESLKAILRGMFDAGSLKEGNYEITKFLNDEYRIEGIKRIEGLSVSTEKK